MTARTRITALCIAGLVVGGAFIVVVQLLRGELIPPNLNSTLIPLPLRFGDGVVAVACNHSDERELIVLDSRMGVTHALAEGRVVKIAWSSRVIACAAHPRKPRAAFPGDTFMKADESVTNWILVDVERRETRLLAAEPELVSAYRAIDGSGADPQWLTLRQAWAASQRQLGFEFSKARIREYIASAGAAAAPQ